MRSVSRLAVFTAALLVGAATIVASEESVRSMRVVEKPEDLATVFADAQTAVTYDSMSGRFYYPSLGLYFDPVTSLFFDPTTGLYRNHVLQGEYTEDSMTGMYYDAVTGLYFDPEKQMTFNSTTSLYHDLESGLDLSWDDSLRMFYDPVAGSYYDRGLGTHLVYDQQEQMFYNAEVGAYYDPELGLYYDKQVGLFYDPIFGRYYDKETGDYYDPDDLGATSDGFGHLRLNVKTGLYFCDLDGHSYSFDSELGLYVSQDSQAPSLLLYYDPKTTFHVIRDFYSETFWVQENQSMYDPATKMYWDCFSNKFYWYDDLLNDFIDMDSGSGFIPRSPNGRAFGATVNRDDVAYAIKWGMTYNEVLGLFWDDSQGSFFEYDENSGLFASVSAREELYYFDPKTGFSLVPEMYGNHFTVLQTGDEYDADFDCFYDLENNVWYRYDEENQRFTIEDDRWGYDPSWMDRLDWSLPKPLSKYEVDRALPEIDLSVPGMYCDSYTQLYTDGCGYFYDKYADVLYFYDLTTCLYYNAETGESWRCPPVSAMPDNPFVDMTNMRFDDWFGMYYDTVKGIWYDSQVGLYYDGRYYFDPETGDAYYYYSSLYYNCETLEVFIPLAMREVDDPLAFRFGEEPSSQMLYYDEVMQMYYDYSVGYYYDAKVGLYYDGWYYYYDPNTWQSYWRDWMTDQYYNCMTGAEWVPGSSSSNEDWNGVDTSNMWWDSMYGMYYDMATGYYYDDTVGLYYDGWYNYYDPQTWEGYWYDSAMNQYYNSTTGVAWSPKSSSSNGGSNGVDTSNMSWDSMYGMYYDMVTGYYYDDTVGLYYDGWYNYYDPQTWESYWYDSMMNQYYNNMTGAAWTPRSSSSNGGSDGVDMSNMFWDSMYGMYYDMVTGYYYDDTIGLYYDGWYNYYDPQTWETYWYDSMMNQYYNGMTGAVWVPKGSSSNGGWNGVDTSNMWWDSMYGMYYDMATGYYYDDKVGLYYDGMCCYYDPQTWRCYYYDSMQDFYYDPMTGERYEPRKKTTGLTQEEIAEIKRQFILLGEANPYASEVNEYDMAQGRVDSGVSLAGEYYVAPFGAADVVWFDNLFNQGMDTSARRVRLRASAMPLQIEVDIESRDMYGYYVPTGLFVEVPEEVWNRATKYVVLTLSPAWSSMMGANGMMWNGNSMTYWTMTPMTGIEGVDSEADFAAYAQYAGNCNYENLFSAAVFRGCWSFDCSGMGMMGDTGLSPSCTRTVGGLLDTDGDGLADVDEYVHGTNPFMSDTDGDGMNDALELRIGSNPTMYDEDSDYDGMADVWEEHFGLNPQNPVDANADPDHDGLNNQREYWLGTNPIEGDTDGDGLRDGDELKHGTNPCNPDTDNDQLPDAVEIARGTNPCNPDTDSDGVQDGAEIGAGLSPLNVDTDDYGVSDRDMLKYDLQNGMGKDDVANRLKTWLPVEVDVVSDSDGDGWLDYVEDMVGSSPHDGADTPERIDGTAQAFELVVTLHQELPHAILLEVDGAQVCLRKPSTVRRWMAEGVVHTLKLIGRQGMQTPISVSFGSSKVKVVDPDGILQGGSQPSSACSNDSTERKAEFYQLGVAFSPDHICFHGSQTVKSVACRMVPDDDAMIRPVWVLGDPWGEVLNCLQDDLVNGVSELGRFEGEYTVNIPRELAGYTLYCLFLDYNNEVVCVGECDIESCWRNSDDHDDGWCITHKCEHGFCACDNMDASLDTWCNLHGCHVVNCPIREEHTDTVNIWPVSDAKNLGEFVYALSSDPVREDGEPYFTKNARRSVAYNDDDDDGNGKKDLDDQIPDFGHIPYFDGIEDNFREFTPFPFDRRCCHCPEHDDLATAEIAEPCDKLGIYTSTSKDKLGGDPWPMHLFAEGRELSSKPCDAKLIWNLDVKDEDRTVITNEFSVYSVRLIPDLDLDKDRVIDAEDEKLVKEMKQLKNLGFCLNPGASRKIKLKCDVLMPGTVKLAVVESRNCSVALEDVPEPLLNGTRENGRWNQDFSVRALKKDQPSEDAYAIVEATYTGSGSAKDYECKARLKITVLDFQIAGDGNRDGKIKFDDPADTNIVFWVNDDYDVLHDHEDMWQEDDSNILLNHLRNCDDDVIGAVEKKRNQNSVPNGYEGNTAYCFRDLEDFDRLHVKVDHNLVGDKEGILYEVRMDSTGDSDAGRPAVNLFEAVAPNRFYLECTKRNEFKDRLEALAEQMEKKRLATADGGAKWQQLELENLCYLNDKLCFLYEGKEYGKGFMKIRVKKHGVVLAEASLRIELHQVGEFIDTYQIDETDETNSANIDELKLRIGIVSSRSAKVSLPGTTDQDRAVLTLGWNVDPKEKVAWRDTVFKRLFWHGYRGRVGTLIWPTTYGFDVDFKSCFKSGHFDGELFKKSVESLNDAANYDRGEHRAWLSGVRAADFFEREIKENVSHITFMAHSQGNILMGEMLRRLSPEVKRKVTYIALQGAISAQLYTNEFMPQNNYDAFNMTAFGMSGTLDRLGRWLNVKKWKWTSEKESPDIYGHFPYGRDGDIPYLEGVLSGLWHTMNYYNRDDYALNIWLGNNGTKPDNLKGVWKNDRSFGFTTEELNGYTGNDQNPYVKLSPAELQPKWISLSNGKNGRFFQNQNGVKVAIYPGNDECSTTDGDEYIEFEGRDIGNRDESGAAATKWCVFSFVTMARSLAIGQLPMNPYFTDNADLAGQFGLGKDHYYHSWEFRSNVLETWPLWANILTHINHGPDEKKPEPDMEKKTGPDEKKPEPDMEKKPEPDEEKKPEPDMEKKPEPDEEKKPEPDMEKKPEPDMEKKPEPDEEKKPETDVEKK